MSWNCWRKLVAVAVLRDEAAGGDTDGAQAGVDGVDGGESGAGLADDVALGWELE